MKFVQQKITVHMNSTRDKYISDARKVLFELRQHNNVQSREAPLSEIEVVIHLENSTETKRFRGSPEH